jgi:hypothetical protein
MLSRYFIVQSILLLTVVFAVLGALLPIGVPRASPTSSPSARCSTSMRRVWLVLPFDPRHRDREAGFPHHHRRPRLHAALRGIRGQISGIKPPSFSD